MGSLGSFEGLFIVPVTCLVALWYYILMLNVLLKMVYIIRYLLLAWVFLYEGLARN